MLGLKDVLVHHWLILHLLFGVSPVYYPGLESSEGLEADTGRLYALSRIPTFGRPWGERQSGRTGPGFELQLYRHRLGNFVHVTSASSYVDVKTA